MSAKARQRRVNAIRKESAAQGLPDWIFDPTPPWQDDPDAPPCDECYEWVAQHGSDIDRYCWRRTCGVYEGTCRHQHHVGDEVIIGEDGEWLMPLFASA